MGINAQRAGVDPVKVGRNARAAGRGVASLVAGANAERTPGPSLPETEIDRLLRALRESAERQLRENR